LQRFIVTIDGQTWKDVVVAELPEPPGEGEPIETKYGTCIVTSVEPSSGREQYAGKIVCRLQ
jgi:hypothetical protein